MTERFDPNLPRRRGVSRAVLVVTLAIVAIGALLLAERLRRRDAVVTTTGPIGTTPSAATSTSGVRRTLTSFRKPTPMPMAFEGCPPTGDGGDPATNALKARGDSATTWLDVPGDSIVALPWPRGVERRDRAKWSRRDAADVARYEGAPVRVEGYFASGKLEGPESVNCHGADTDRRDWHLWLASAPGPARERSIVVETTPFMRARHARWTIAAIRALARDGTPVRVSGWLMLDPEHPDQIGKTRGTIWEIHPIVAIEVRRGGDWIPLDDDTPPTRRRRTR